MKEKLLLKIYSLEGEKEYKVDKVILPTFLGQITVLLNHQPLMCLIKKGKISFWNEQGENQILVQREAFAKIEQKKVEIFLI